jgi:putative ABC transport system ATP-binding protein
VPEGPIIKVVEVKKAYGEAKARQEVLRGVSLEVEAGDFVALVGQSGSGKSTLLNIIGGLDSPDSGTIVVDGHDYAKLDDEAQARLRNHRIGFIFQSFHLLDHLSVLENVAMPAFFNENPGEAASKARAALARVGLAEVAERRPSALSGGQKQRVAIARALFNKPALLLCDEPTGNLDSETGRGVIDLFRELNREGLTLVIVTHEERVSQAARRVLRIADGRLLDQHSRSVELSRPIDAEADPADAAAAASPAGANAPAGKATGS